MNLIKGWCQKIKDSALRVLHKNGGADLVTNSAFPHQQARYVAQGDAGSHSTYAGTRAAVGGRGGATRAGGGSVADRMLWHVMELEAYGVLSPQVAAMAENNVAAMGTGGDR